MPRLDWDRLRRARPLDDADARLDPDGLTIWERSAHAEARAFFRRPLPPGVIRRTRAGEAAPPTKAADRPPRG